MRSIVGTCSPAPAAAGCFSSETQFKIAGRIPPSVLLERPSLVRMPSSRIRNQHLEIGETRIKTEILSKMIVRCCVIYLLLHLTGKVSLQDSANEFNRVVGDSVTLPCISVNQQPSTDVFWRLNASIKVLNIIDGKPSTENQDGIFKNRTESFPSEYAKGNYSVELKDLKLTHAGVYTCFLLNSNEAKKMQLFVKEKPDKPTDKPEKPTQNQKNSCMGKESLKIMTLLTALLGLTLHLI